MNGHGSDSARVVTVLTPENLEVRYELAGLASRGLAWGFDFLIQTLICALAMLGLSLCGLLLQVGAEGDAHLVAMALLVFLVFVIINGYFIFFEVRCNGETPGKKALHLRAIKEGGYPLTFRDSLVRNLLRFVDWLPALYGVGALAMLLTRDCRRLGDVAAATYVIYEEPPPPRVRDVAAARFAVPQARRLDDAWIELIRQFQMRAPYLNRRHRVRVAERLARSVAARLDLDVARERSSEGFLADVLASADEPA